MSLKGSFSLYSPQRLRGHIKLWQFVLKNTNMMFSETVDIMLMDCYGQKPFYFRNVKLKAGQSVAFNLDTVDWEWYQDDFAAIIDSNNRIHKKWQFHIKEYNLGECPECHGTHKCRKCSGKGFVNLPRHTIEQCDVCHGTGICQTCYVPQRTSSPFQSPIINGVTLSKTPRDRQIENLRKNISDLQSKIEKTQWDMRMMQLKDMERTNSSVYLSYNHLLYQYNIQMINLQSQLEQLEQM